MLEENLKNEINALLDLLDDPDSMVYESVHKRFMQIGSSASEMLENAWSLSLDESYQKRVEYILDDISKNHAAQLSKKWLLSNPDDLLEGYLIFTLYQYPNLNKEELMNQLENLKISIWIELNDNLTSLEKIRVINHILFRVQKFERDTSPIENPKFNYLNRLLQSKIFSNHSIALLYLILAKKLDIPMEGIIFRGSPLLCYLNDSNKKNDEITPNDILFYIDPYNQGNILPKDVLKDIGARLSSPAEARDFLPVNSWQLILKIVHKTAITEKANNNHKKSEDLMYFYSLLKEMKD
jgi:hypothetical protein